MILMQSHNYKSGLTRIVKKREGNFSVWIGVEVPVETGLE